MYLKWKESNQSKYMKIINILKLLPNMGSFSFVIYILKEKINIFHKTILLCNIFVFSWILKVKGGYFNENSAYRK